MKRVDVGGLQPDDPAHPVGGQIALVDEAVEGAGGDPEAPGRLLGRQPLDVRRGCHVATLAHTVLM